jgi:DUF1365 family protein
VSPPGPPLHSALYVGQVVHRRLRPVRHRFTYRVFSLLLDLDELPELTRRLTLFAHDRPAPVGFRQADHGPGDGTPLKEWIGGQLGAAGIEAGGPVRVLCFPRLLGLVFNPLSVWFCHREDGALAAILYEVNNTFGQRHSYLIPVAGGQDPVRQHCRKGFYVSPFMPMDSDYHFRVEPPGERVGVAIRQTEPDGTLLHAALAGRRRPLTDATLAAAWLGHPLMSVKVLAGIHWEALRLWRRGLSLQPRPRPPALPVTLVRPVGGRDAAA